MDYNLELDRIVSEINALIANRSLLIAGERRTADGERPIKICLQFPDGLKASATEVIKELERKTKDEKRETAFYIWSGSNFGGCDYPWYLKDLGFDLLVNFGHCVFKKTP